jgi:hypothetical protein
MSSEPEHAVHLDKVSLSLKQGCGVWGVSGPVRTKNRTDLTPSRPISRACALRLSVSPGSHSTRSVITLSDMLSDCPASWLYMHPCAAV